MRAVIVMALLTACLSPSEATSPVGTYALATIDGRAIPTSDDGAFVVRSSVTLQSNGVFLYSRVDSFPATPGAPNEATADFGAWTLTADSLLMRSDTRVYRGMLAGSQLLLVQGGASSAWLYTRQ
jgi:hypothetical protein